MTQVAIMDMGQNSRPTDGGQTKFGRQMKEAVLTEFVRMFRTDSGTIASASATALSGSVSSTSCAMRTQPSHLRDDCGVVLREML